MATLFDDFDPIATGPGSVLDYDATVGEAAQTAFGRGLEMNPVAYLARQARYFSEDMGNIIGETDWVDAEKARAEIKNRSLDLKVPDNGMSRYELDTLQYLKQREINATALASRPHSLAASAAGIAGGFAAGAVDPLNVATAFIPVVREARYASWLARAGESALARAAVRAQAGAIEGAAGAALLEPIVYAGAQAEQTEYGVADSFVNVMFGGVLGGGLHVPTGAVYDWRVGRALASLDVGLRAVEFRDAAARAPDEVHLSALQQATTALDTDGPVRAADVIASKLSPEQARRLAEMPGETKVDGVPVERMLPATEEDIAHFTKRRDEAIKRGDAEVAARWQSEIDEASAKPGEGPAALRDVGDKSSATEPPPAPRNGMVRMYHGGAPEGVTGPLWVTSSLEDAKGWASRSSGMKVWYVDVPEEVLVRGFEVKTIKEAQELGFAPLSRVEIPAELASGRKVYNETPVRDQARADTRRTLDDLIPEARAQRTEGAFTRQFVDEPAATDRWAQEDAEVSAAADREVAAAAKEPTEADVAADLALTEAHLVSMRTRGMLGADEEAIILAGHQEAERLESEAAAYDAAGACDIEEG